MFEIKEVKSSKDIKAFVKLPFDIYKGNKYWVPPVINDEVKQMNPHTNPFYEYCEAKFWTAWEGKKCIGRIGAIINHEYNKIQNIKAGRISRTEFVDNAEVINALFEKAEYWLKEQGMTLVHGPLGFSNLDHQGLLIDGFDFIPSIASVYHQPYYKGHFERLGYKKENDWVEFRLTLGEAATQKGIRGSALIKKRYGFEVKTFTSSKEMAGYAQPIFKILNEAFSELPYVTPFTDKMIQSVGESYLKILNPKFVKVIYKGDELVGFVIGLPSLSQAMQKAQGKLLPYGFFYVLKALKKPEVIDLLLTGVKPEYHSAGVAVILFAELQQTMMEMGIDQMETTGIFETNQNVISNWKNYQHIQHKRRRCFVKDL
jgi:hypothetical protein